MGRTENDAESWGKNQKEEFPPSKRKEKAVKRLKL